MTRSMSTCGQQQVLEMQTLHGLAEDSESRDQEFGAPFGATASSHASLGVYMLSWMTSHELKPALHARDSHQLLRHCNSCSLFRPFS